MVSWWEDCIYEFHGNQKLSKFCEMYCYFQINQNVVWCYFGPNIIWLDPWVWEGGDTIRWEKRTGWRGKVGGQSHLQPAPGSSSSKKRFPNPILELILVGKGECVGFLTDFHICKRIKGHFGDLDGFWHSKRSKLEFGNLLKSGLETSEPKPTRTQEALKWDCFRDVGCLDLRQFRFFIFSNTFCPIAT